MGKALVDIVVYHDIALTLDAARGLSNPLYTASLKRFKKHLEWIRRSSYTLIRLNEWLDARNNGDLWDGKYLLLTFDGPHTGWFDHVLPLLTEMEVPATFFVIAGWVGEKHAFPESRHLTWDQVAALESYRSRDGRQLFDVGSHSMWHTTLDTKTDETEQHYAKRLDEEIIRSTSLIRDKTGLPVRSYAVPEGQGDLSRLQRLFRDAGLEAVRWANFWGEKNSFEKDLFDLQISYCDTSNQYPDQLSIVLSNTYTAFMKRAFRRFLLELRVRMKWGETAPRY